MNWSASLDGRLLALGNVPAAAAAATLSAESGLTITEDAARNRRRRLVRNEQNEAKAASSGVDGRVPVPAASGYIGPTIAFWDLETTFSTQPRLLSGAIADGFGEVHEYNLYNFPGETWIDDRPLAIAIRDAIEQYSIIAGWNSKLFDIPVLNGRLAYWGERPARPHMHVDLMYYASGSFMRIGRRSLESVSKYFSSPNQKTPLSPMLWDRADHGDADAYRLILEHNRADALVTRDVYAHLAPHIRNIHRGG